MPYIVKSSLEIESTIVPWNKHESEKLIKEKKEYFKKKQEETKHAKDSEIKEKVVEEPKQEELESKIEVTKEIKTFKNDRRNQKAGDK